SSRVTSASGAPSPSRCVLRMCVARSRSPRLNQLAPPYRLSHFKHSNESSFIPHPRSGSTRPQSVYITVSMSGHTRKPCRMMSSPVLAMTVSCDGSITDPSPSSSLDAPIPPARAVTFKGPAHLFVLFSIGTSLAMLETYDPKSSRLDLVAAINPDRQHRHSLNYTCRLKAPCIYRPQPRDRSHGLDYKRPRLLRLADYKVIAVQTLV